jgi:glyoxylate carboligase
MDFDDVPVKPQRVFKEINEFFGEDTIFVTAIGLYQIFRGRTEGGPTVSREISRPIT